MPNLNLDNIINVVVTQAQTQAVREGLNVGLIIGQSAHFAQSLRAMEFSSIAEVGAVYSASEPEYKAAALYFGQSAVPRKVIIARRFASDVTAGFNAAGGSGAIADFAAKVGYIDGRYVFAYDGTAWKHNGVTVTLADYGLTFSGSPTSSSRITVVYTSGGTQETWEAALADVCDKFTGFYGVYAAGISSDSDRLALAAYCESSKLTYFFESNADSAITSGTNDIFSSMKNAGYSRSFGLYSSSDHAAAAVMGYAMGANTGAVNSAYTLAYKRLYGVEVEDITEAEAQILKAKNANVYVKRGNYELLERGTTASGEWYDYIIGVDQLAQDLQNACMDVLVNAGGKVPYTDEGALQFVLACNGVCEDAVKTGYLAPGVWNGNTVMGINNGDALEAGYLCQTDRVANMSAEDKEARKAPPVYVCAILAGAIHSVVIRVDVE